MNKRPPAGPDEDHREDACDQALSAAEDRAAGARRRQVRTRRVAWAARAGSRHRSAIRSASSPGSSTEKSRPLCARESLASSGEDAAPIPGRASGSSLPQLRLRGRRRRRASALKARKVEGAPATSRPVMPAASRARRHRAHPLRPTGVDDDQRPHLSSSERIAVVRNIIETPTRCTATPRRAKHVKFLAEIAHEVLAHLVNRVEAGSLETPSGRLQKNIIGTCSIAIVDAQRQQSGR